MTSDYVPPPHEAVMDGMTALFEQIKAEPEPSVRAVLGQWLFGFVHSYQDGNGRTSRFLLNALLASGGYPWAIVRVEDRQRYLAGLNAASQPEGRRGGICRVHDGSRRCDYVG